MLLQENSATWNPPGACACTTKTWEKSVSCRADVTPSLLNAGELPAAKEQGDAIHAAWKDMLADPNLKLVFAANRVDVSSSGDMASTAGSYTMTMTNPKTKKPVEDKGTYITVVWQKAG